MINPRLAGDYLESPSLFPKYLPNYISNTYIIYIKIAIFLDIFIDIKVYSYITTYKDINTKLSVHLFAHPMCKYNFLIYHGYETFM